MAGIAYPKILSLTALLALAVNLATPAYSQAPAQAAQIAGARALVLRIIHPKPDQAPWAGLYTRRSAAFIGLDVYLILVHFIKAEPAATASDKAKRYQATKELSALGQKYGIHNIGNDPAEINRLEFKGRPFYTDIIMATKRIVISEPSYININTYPPQMTKNIKDYTFTPASPTEVKIGLRKPGAPALKAVFEEGKWRFDMGGLHQSRILALIKSYGAT